MFIARMILRDNKGDDDVDDHVDDDNGVKYWSVVKHMRIKITTH